MPPKPGYQTTEFWLALIAQALGFAVLLGFVSFNDSKTLEEALGKTVAAVFTVLTSARTVFAYIKSRTALKTAPGHEPVVVPSESDPDDERPRDGSFPRLKTFLLFVIGAAFAGGPLAHAAQPYLPWRQQINERLRFQEKLIHELIAQKHAPQTQPPIIVLPIPGQPKQDLPIGGPPKQDLPIGGDPKLKPPIDGPPKQDLPPKGDPKHDLPPSPPGEPQRLSIIRALCPTWRPAR